MSEGVNRSSPEPSIATELSMRRTGMSFQRTRLSADRTLMSVIRTSLSMIGFGFTIYQIFQKMVDSRMVTDASAPRHFGAALLVLGVFMLIAGIGYHFAFMVGMRKQRRAMHDQGILYAESDFPVSLTLITAVLLLLIGLAAAASVLWRAGPLQ